MKVRILKGTNQIGGCITEISTDKTKIIIDLGEDLPDEKNNTHINPGIDGLTIGKAKYDAVFITHSHGDHIGLIDFILEDIPVYVESKSKGIYEILNDFTNKVKIRETMEFNFEEDILIKDIKLTPYIVDHSAYNSAMFVIESDNKKILHTGDFRNNGYKGKLLVPLIKKIGKIDCLITEGTSIGRSNEINLTEAQLTIKAEAIFENYNQIFILQSSTNIDRISSFYKASIRTGKVFVEDLFTANITSYLKGHIPNPIDFKNVYVWKPLKYNKKTIEFQKKYCEPLKEYMNSKSVYKDYTMLVKTSMISDIKLLKEKNTIKKACLIYSMWEGYKKQESFKNFFKEIEKLNIDIIDLHTSGHADEKTLKLVYDLTNPDDVILIHTSNKEKGNELFKNIRYISDLEEMEIK